MGFNFEFHCLIIPFWLAVFFYNPYLIYFIEIKSSVQITKVFKLLGDLSILNLHQQWISLHQTLLIPFINFLLPRVFIPNLFCSDQGLFIFRFLGLLWDSLQHVCFLCRDLNKFPLVPLKKGFFLFLLLLPLFILYESY